MRWRAMARKPGIGEDHLVLAGRGGVALDVGRGVAEQRVMNGGEARHEPLDLAGDVRHGAEPRGHQAEQRRQLGADAIDGGGERCLVTGGRGGVMGEQHPEHIEREHPGRPADPDGDATCGVLPGEAGDERGGKCAGHAGR